MHGYRDGRFVDFAVSDDERVVMGNLETLFIDYTEVPWLFARLSLPALTMLRVESTVWSSFVYQSLQSRSSFSLNSVSLCHVKLEEADFLDLLRDTPSLTEVILCDVLVLTPTLVTSLASNPPYRSPVLGPNLEYLGICWTFIQENESSESAQALNEAILDMISSRDPTGGPAAYMWNGGPPGTKVFTSRSPRQPLCNGEAPQFALKEHSCREGGSRRIIHIFF
ncbi:hypothetical protein Hypma_004882 [Hypsizygus marmoreus]|uniref:F-box domain-containing protein n=1 Tax=Hypsizygus marmoreus TaxID=39966 RepID=A0A369K8J1_HYPMA|nr:hypothetical protein Hypma_004882 [Hypsizygus marmoreus]